MKYLEEFVERHKWKPRPDTVESNDILPRCASTMRLDRIYTVYTFDNGDKSRAAAQEYGAWHAVQPQIARMYRHVSGR